MTIGLPQLSGAVASRAAAPGVADPVGVVVWVCGWFVVGKSGGWGWGIDGVVCGGGLGG